MKKFKIFFYPIYLLIAIVTLYYSIDIITHQQEYMEKVSDFATLRKLPEYMLMVIILCSLLMMVEIIVENIHLFRWKRKAESMKEEVLKLKAKLYDEGQSTMPKLEENLEEDEEEEDEGDYLGMNDEEEKD